MNQLQKLETWKKELALAETFEEIKVHDSAASAAAEFARRQGVALDKQNEIGRFRIDIEDKKGQWLDETFKHGSINKYTKVGRSNCSTFLNMPVSKDESSNARLLNRQKELADKVMNEIEERGEVITPNKVTKEVRRTLKQESLKENVLKTRIKTKQNENIKNGNCLEILETLEDGCIDIVLTDSPYGIDYKSNRSMFDDIITKRGLLNDNKIEAFDLLDKTCEILKRKTAENSHLYFFCNWNIFSAFSLIISKYFTIKTPIIWDKGNKGSGDLVNDWGNQTEIIIYCVKGKKLVNNRRGNVINVPRLHTSKMIHPTQKPNQLIKEILDVSGCEGDFVVDPFMGSGSTIKVCNEMRLKSLGIELDKEMFNIANNFING
tara:strand:- start:1806 stop:2939 length:1134 start_codon:yes stop_codon:yes gene_type:complete